jgi:hypothetical protein
MADLTRYERLEQVGRGLAPPVRAAARLNGDRSWGQIAPLARLRWRIELDYRQPKGKLGRDHYGRRSWRDVRSCIALVTCTYP